MGKPDKLIICNMLEGGKAPMRIECAAGELTLLEDCEGTYLEHYKLVLTGKESSQRILLEYNANNLDLSQVAYVGFDNQLPDGCTIKQVLLQRNLSEQEALQTISQFELERFDYLFAAQLPAPQARQLELILALRFDQPIIVLNDPFQPLNGRWKEEYARLILEKVQARKLVAVCINVSFIPQAWVDSKCISRQDLSKCANKALERYVMEQRTERERQRDKEKEREKEKEKANKAAQNAAAQAALADQASKAVTKIDPVTGKEVVHYELPENLNFAYRCTRDYIFEPLAEISTFLARYHLVVGVLGFACMIALMAFVMFPDVRAQWSRIMLKQESINPNAEINPAVQNSRAIPVASVKPQATAEITSEELTAEPNVDLSAAEIPSLAQDSAVDSGQIQDQKNSTEVQALNVMSEQSDPLYLDYLSDHTLNYRQMICSNDDQVN